MIVLTIALLLCAAGALYAKRLLVSVVALIGMNAGVSLLMALYGVPLLAVINLSVGTGLVAVLLVFTISLIGEESVPHRPVVPAIVVAPLLMTLGLVLSIAFASLEPVQAAVPTLDIMWDEQRLNTLLQLVLLFAGLISVLDLLPERVSS